MFTVLSTLGLNSGCSEGEGVSPFCAGAVILGGALPTGKEKQMPQGKGFFESLLDFSLRECVTTNNRKLLYGLHLLFGLIAAVALVVIGFQTSPTQGLINLIEALVGLFFWVLYVRIGLEFLLAVFRIAEAASPASNVREER